MRSVIFQAKLRPANGEHVIDHQFQRTLYDECQGFRYETVLAGQDRRIPAGPNRERALQYLFVADKPVRTRTIPAAAGLGAFVDYGEHLLRFLNDATGMEVLPRPDESVGWSRIVWDMIDEVAQKVTSQAMPRNQGLREVLDYFNSFESHDRFYFEPEQAREEGFGMQLVIVWDSQLDGRSITHAMVPKDLFTLARLYDTTNIADYDERIKMKDEWARKMAGLLKQGIPRRDVADLAKSLKSNGLIAALGQAVVEAPENGDGQLLIDLLPFVSWKHAIKRVLFALARLAENGQLSTDQMENVIKLAQKHPLASQPHVDSLVKHLGDVIHIQLEIRTKDQPQSIRLEE
jgi:hypothetical protein